MSLCFPIVSFASLLKNYIRVKCLIAFYMLYIIYTFQYSLYNNISNSIQEVHIESNDVILILGKPTNIILTHMDI